MGLEGRVVVVTGGASGVAEQAPHQSDDPDRWLAGIRRLVARAAGR